MPVNQVNLNIFKQHLTTAYVDLFANDPEYAYSASRKTPEQLADCIANGLATSDTSKDGEGIKRACKAVKIKQTYKEIKAFLNSPTAQQP
jgi:tryptophan synthase alpha subunit